ncbi:hypothetical protein ANO14919_013320 [Xylariales sp. No.14919]|nr:hypothetical protein ANO14919_013320 [Xylariales sp. No.14919]
MGGGGCAPTVPEQGYGQESPKVYTHRKAHLRFEAAVIGLSESDDQRVREEGADYPPQDIPEA